MTKNSLLGHGEVYHNARKDASFRHTQQKSKRDKTAIVASPCMSQCDHTEGNERHRHGDFGSDKFDEDGPDTFESHVCAGESD